MLHVFHVQLKVVLVVAHQTIRSLLQQHMETPSEFVDQPSTTQAPQQNQFSHCRCRISTRFFFKEFAETSQSRQASDLPAAVYGRHTSVATTLANATAGAGPQQ